MSDRARLAMMLAMTYHVLAFALIVWLVGGFVGPIIMAWAGAYVLSGWAWHLMRPGRNPPRLYDDERG